MSLKSWTVQKKGNVTSPKGFSASGMHAGIKKSKKKYDVSLIYSKKPCVAAATFTTNKVKAWPVLYSMKAIKSAQKHHAFLASSGNANCVNGKRGKDSVLESVEVAAKALRITKEEIIIAQTGLIGVPFPTTCFKRAIPTLVKKLSLKGGRNAAKGIMTTDTKTKEVAVSFSLGKKKVTIGAMSKGAGMIHPGMGTMLCFITSDVSITKQLLRRALKQAVDESFNKMSIDNDMSTNDMASVLANGASGAKTINKVGKEYNLFRDALTEVCQVMAHKMVDDGEGVGHVCRLEISGAKNVRDAEKAARHIANSMLFKTMLTGADPNWGRIIAAIGASGVDFKMEQVDVVVGNVMIVKQGKLRALSLPKARKVLSKREYGIHVVIGKGRGRSKFLTSDLTVKYVQINAEYS